MANDLIVPVILAGGKGTRLWPMSRSQRPKQFLALTGDLSLFQLTLKRLADPARYDKPIVVTNSEYRFLVAEQAQEAGVELEAVLLEPAARNTAPAIALAAPTDLRRRRYRMSARRLSSKAGKSPTPKSGSWAGSPQTCAPSRR